MIEKGGMSSIWATQMMISVRFGPILSVRYPPMKFPATAPMP